MRKRADRLDEGVEVGIVGTVVAEEPLPQPIVLAVQQPSENRPLGFGGHRPTLVEPPLEQPVEFPHATPAAPTQTTEFEGIVFRHGRSFQRHGVPGACTAPERRDAAVHAIIDARRDRFTMRGRAPSAPGSANGAGIAGVAIELDRSSAVICR